jgi:hypothetical protein
MQSLINTGGGSPKHASTRDINTDAWFPANGITGNSLRGSSREVDRCRSKHTHGSNDRKPSPTPPNLAARRLALSVALIPHLPPPHLRRSLLARFTPCRRIPAPPSLWASLPTWQELADEAQAAAVFFFSPASRDAPGRSPGTCRRHHRREAAPSHPTSSTPRSVPPPPHPTHLRLQFRLRSRLPALRFDSEQAQQGARPRGR